MGEKGSMPVLDSRLRGNDGLGVWVFSPGASGAMGAPLLMDEKGSMPLLDSRLRGNDEWTHLPMLPRTPFHVASRTFTWCVLFQHETPIPVIPACFKRESRKCIKPFCCCRVRHSQLFENPSHKEISSPKSRHCGLCCSIRFNFQDRFHFLICFSLVIALSVLSCTSK